MSTRLTAEKISKDYPTRGGPLPVLRGVDLNLAAGEAAAIVGPSGCGKSTLLNILGTLESPTSGRLQIDGCDPFALDESNLAEFRNQRIGFVFQEHHLLPHCSVIENVLVPTLASGGAAKALGRARELLDRVGLSARLDHRPAELSGGERQRAAIARALINSPALVLADEPTGNLDRTSGEAVANLLLELQRAEKTILIVVTHSMALANHLGRCFELDDGTLKTAAGARP